MPMYQVIASLEVTRAYSVEAINAEQAEELVREEHEFIPYDVIATDVAAVTVED